jgi:NADP-dependent 3-hydroxy acid dehydrogenase YdfG
MSKIALITGATAGIGEACARLFAQQNYNLILLARRSDRLESLSKILSSEFGIKVQTLVVDVRDKEAVKRLETLPEEWKKVTVLVNNAGLSRGLIQILKVYCM